MRKQAARGFTLIELLVVVAIIGILAAIAIPNLLSAIQRSKQRRTMADIRSIATAWEARYVDTGRYNAAGVVIASVPIDVGVLATYLEPTYIKEMPLIDAWGKRYVCYMDQPVGGGEAASEYVVSSAGRDGTFSDPPYFGPFSNYDCDIIYSDGVFISFPDGFGQANN